MISPECERAAVFARYPNTDKAIHNIYVGLPSEQRALAIDCPVCGALFGKSCYHYVLEFGLHNCSAHEERIVRVHTAENPLLSFIQFKQQYFVRQVYPKAEVRFCDGFYRAWDGTYCLGDPATTELQAWKNVSLCKLEAMREAGAHPKYIPVPNPYPMHFETSEMKYPPAAGEMGHTPYLSRARIMEIRDFPPPYNSIQFCNASLDDLRALCDIALQVHKPAASLPEPREPEKFALYPVNKCVNCGGFIFLSTVVTDTWLHWESRRDKCADGKHKAVPVQPIQPAAPLEERARDYQTTPFPVDTCRDFDQGFFCKLKPGHGGDHFGTTITTGHQWS